MICEFTVLHEVVTGTYALHSYRYVFAFHSPFSYPIIDSLSSAFLLPQAVRVRIDASEPRLRLAIDARGSTPGRIDDEDESTLASLRAELSGLAERMEEVEENLSEGLAAATAERGSLSSQVGDCCIQQ